MWSLFRVAGITIATLLLSVPAVRAVEQEAINRAIDRGVAYLKQLQRDNGSWPHDEDSGATSLAALSLLECGESPQDPAVQKATRFIREASVNCTHSYSISLAILYLDRLGDPADVPLIESLAVRLLAGQNGSGAWAYHCPPISDNEVLRLKSIINDRKNPSPGVPPANKPAKRELSKEIQAQLAIIGRAVPDANQRGTGDNSNTQFAALALWVARRHGIPVDQSLARVEARFRASQGSDNGWGYGNFPHQSMLGQEPSNAAMTCAGLIGLVVNKGAVQAVQAQRNPNAPPQKQDLTRDPAIKNGLAVLATTIDHPVSQKRGAQVQIFSRGGKNYYFLWSLERVAVAYGLKTIGDKDWYGFGSEILVANQREDGSWQGDFGRCGADTCFALLFLKRANAAKDLTAILQGEPIPVPAMQAAEPARPHPQPGLAQPGEGPRPAQPDVKPINTTSDKPSTTAIVPTGFSDLKDRPLPMALATKPEVEAARLGAELVSAPADKQVQLLDKFRSCKGVTYTLALAGAIPKLSQDTQPRARQALAEHMTCLSSDVLRQCLHDDSQEVRRASTQALGLKGDKAAVPDIIPILEDREAEVARTAHTALKLLTSQDFGPANKANRDECVKAVAAWKAWWSQQK